MRWLLQISFTVMALVASASVSSAADCSSDPNECTPKKLCEVATQVENGNKFWSTNTNASKHISYAQELGMTCGVVAVKGTCDTDPSECKISQLCEKATTESAGQINWDSAAESYVAVAKEYGLSCDVQVQLNSDANCSDDPKACEDRAS